MGITFLQPWSWVLASAIALPIAIHLLARNRSREVPFPSVRFLEATKLSAVTRQRLQDGPLLAVRVALLLMAVGALAVPVITTPARQAAWTLRVARAVVLDDRAAPPEDELRSAATGAVFARARLQDAVADAQRWLAAQAQSAREIVVFSAFHRGAIAAADLVGVPAPVGIRLVRTSNGTDIREREITRLELRDAGVVRVTERLTIGPATTEVREVGADVVDVVPIAVTAPVEDQSAADAALRAVLRRGLRLPPAGLMHPISVPWPGDVSRLAAMLEARVAAPLDGWEPEAMPDQELAALERPVRPDEDARPEDQGDRRTLWLMVLVLLGVETWMRRNPS